MPTNGERWGISEYFGYFRAGFRVLTLSQRSPVQSCVWALAAPRAGSGVSQVLPGFEQFLLFLLFFFRAPSLLFAPRLRGGFPFLGNMIGAAKIPTKERGCGLQGMLSARFDLRGFHSRGVSAPNKIISAQSSPRALALYQKCKRRVLLARGHKSSRALLLT